MRDLDVSGDGGFELIRAAMPVVLGERREAPLDQVDLRTCLMRRSKLPGLCHVHRNLISGYESEYPLALAFIESDGPT
jgi:hypothetical protein